MREQATYLSRIFDDIMRIQETLKQDLTYRDKVSERWYSISNGVRRVLADNPQDYIIIHKFYTAIIIRNSEISNKEVEEIVKINKQLIGLAETTLKSIDWKKYKALGGPGVISKDPHIASIIAILGGIIFLLGIGHIYVERLRRAIILLGFSTFVRISTIILTVLYVEQTSYPSSLYSIQWWIGTLDLAFKNPIGLTLFALFIVYIVIWVWQVFDVKKLARKFNKDVENIS